MIINACVLCYFNFSVLLCIIAKMSVRTIKDLWDYKAEVIGPTLPMNFTLLNDFHIILCVLPSGDAFPVHSWITYAMPDITAPILKQLHNTTV